MSCKVAFDFVSFITLVALEWSFNSMCVPVPLQITRNSACIVALVTFVRVFTNVLSHHVDFQIPTCNTCKLAQCASVHLFSRVYILVQLQVACSCCLIFTLIAFVQFPPNVLLDMHFEVGSLVA